MQLPWTRTTRAGLQIRHTRGLMQIDPDTYALRVPAMIDDMIKYASEHKHEGVELVQTEYNGVTIIVASKSNPLLILRDYYRCICGHRTIKVVGPYPEPELPGLQDYTKEQLATAEVWETLAPRRH